MLSDRWIQHQRKQNRSQLEQQNQKPVETKAQDYFRKSSVTARTIEILKLLGTLLNNGRPRREVSKLSVDLVESQIKSPMPPLVPANRTSPTRGILIVENPKFIETTVRSDVQIHNHRYDNLGTKKNTRDDEKSSSASVSPGRKLNSPSVKFKKKLSSKPESRIDPLAPRRSAHNSKSIWVEGDVAPVRSVVDQSNIASVVIAKKRNQLLQNTARNSTLSAPKVEKPKYNIVLQPELLPLSQEQLIAKAKAVYQELVAVETKCISYHRRPDSLVRALTHQDDLNSPLNLSHEGIRTVLEFHQKLLYQHYDFFRATQHPTACLPLKALASKCSMPARLWRHGIHPALELLRKLLPLSLDYMLAFIYTSYSTIALLYETVSVFEKTWIECLGDLSRYRMAIENDNMRDREIWTNVARNWYTKASSKIPSMGRLYNHLAILAKPDLLEQLYYYSKSVCSPNPFTSAHESIQTLLDSVLDEKADEKPTLDILFVRTHGLLYSCRDNDSLPEIIAGLTEHFIDDVKNNKKMQYRSYLFAIVNCSALLEYGSKNNVFMRLLTKNDDELPDENDSKDLSAGPCVSESCLKSAQYLNSTFIDVISNLFSLYENSILSYVHVILVFLYYVGLHPGAMDHIKPGLPLSQLVKKINIIIIGSEITISKEDSEFPYPKDDDFKPLPEDYAMRGLIWTRDYFPEKWFSKDEVADQDIYVENLFLTRQRRERIVWLSHKIVKLDSQLKYRNDEPSLGPGYFDYQ
ncbi:putative telomerase-binding protein est1a protein [Golovinomyces cichoracearum]|uniref:Putative telomerase-binding protein est1a protein n=1 Tax=Golovinomyces cichoracearum TaxID=62708 RepID=A0A420IUN1_9PEZI|nr:putative telomerase-binding protein est1a protein [Golovinomyces cichoracearum]